MAIDKELRARRIRKRDHLRYMDRELRRDATSRIIGASVIAAGALAIMWGYLLDAPYWKKAIKEREPTPKESPLEKDAYSPKVDR